MLENPSPLFAITHIGLRELFLILTLKLYRPLVESLFMLGNARDPKKVIFKIVCALIQYYICLTQMRIALDVHD